MISRTGPSRLSFLAPRTWARVCLLCLAAVLAAPSLLLGGESAAATAAPVSMRRDGPATVELAGGVSIVGKVVEKEIVVETIYGTLRVPFEEVIQVRFGLELDGEAALRLKQLVAELEKAGVDSEEGKKSIGEIRELGVAAVPALRRARQRIKKDDVRARVEEIIEELHPGDDTYVDEEDQIVSERFTMKGQIVLDRIRIESIIGTIEVPCRDLRSITLREIELKKTWKIGPEHIETAAPLATGVKVRRGQKISLVPSGTMSYQGYMFGPAGMSNWTWNGRQMGCLQWRIGGSGPWQILGAKFEGPAPAAGELQFCVHLTGGTSEGEFAVAFKTRRR